MIQPPPSPAQPTDLPQAAEMLCELAVALGDSGTPAHRLEDALVRCSRNLGVRASFFAMPTAVFAAFDAPPHPAPPGSLEISAHTRLIRVQSGETDLARLTDLDGLLDGVSSGRFSVAEARRRIAGVRSRPPLYSRGLTLACFGVVGACAARLFGAGWHEQSAASLAGLGVGATVIYGGRRLGPVADFVAGLLAAAVAVAAAGWFRPCSARTVMLAGLIVLIPGLTLTLAVTELATRNLVAGTARLMGAMTTFVGIGFGAAIGQQAVGRALGVEAVAGTASPSLPDWTLPLSLLLV
ncbi:MAG: threonine/serine exporter family protein, partial [Phycisphaerales bacterium]|nr:threonine/serine exporter family protein [Phycisphaerales bacterium]